MGLPAVVASDLGFLVNIYFNVTINGLSKDDQVNIELVNKLPIEGKTVSLREISSTFRAK